MFVNLLEEAALLEEAEQGLKSIPVAVEEEARAVLRAMIRLGNEQISQALAKLFIAGVNAGRAMPNRTSV